MPPLPLSLPNVELTFELTDTVRKAGWEEITRLLEPSEFESAESLQEECKEFLEKITQFNALVQSITQVFEAHANQIQTEKLKTIGLRNIIDMQRENQRRKEQQLGADVEDTTHELERLTRTYESLMKVEGEQRILIDKLSNSEL